MNLRVGSELIFALGRRYPRLPVAFLRAIPLPVPETMRGPGLRTAEEDLRHHQEQNRAIVLQDQTKGAIEAAARLKGEIMASEVQLQVMRNFATEANRAVPGERPVRPRILVNVARRRH
jgi:hypothetical protein